MNEWSIWSLHIRIRTKKKAKDRIKKLNLTHEQFVKSALGITDNQEIKEVIRAKNRVRR